MKNIHTSVRTISIQFLLFTLIAGGISACNLNTEKNNAEIVTESLPNVEENVTKSPAQIWLDKIETIRNKEWQRRYHQNFHKSYTIKFSEPVLAEDDVVRGEFEQIVSQNNGYDYTMKLGYETISENQLKIISAIHTSESIQSDVTYAWERKIATLDLLDDGNMLVIDWPNSFEIFVAQ